MDRNGQFITINGGGDFNRSEAGSNANQHFQRFENLSSMSLEEIYDP